MTAKIKMAQDYIYPMSLLLCIHFCSRMHFLVINQFHFKSINFPDLPIKLYDTKNDDGTHFSTVSVQTESFCRIPNEKFLKSIMHLTAKTETRTSEYFEWLNRFRFHIHYGTKY